MSPRTSLFDSTASAQRMQLRYGFNEIDGWAAFALGEHREEIRRRIRLMGTKVIRVFVFDKPVPDPVREWHHFAAVLQAVLDAGAKPMVTFAKFHPPFDNARNIRDFVARSCEIVWSCLEQWGGEEVKDWYWCVWNEPNNPDVGGDVAYAQYRRIYEELATGVLALLEPHLGGQKARFGGPAIDGTQRAFWMDWIAQLVTDLDDGMLGFVSWHMYADWRPAVPSELFKVKLWGAPEFTQWRGVPGPGDGADPAIRSQGARRCEAAARPEHIERVRRAEYRGASRERVYAWTEPECVRGRVLCFRTHPSDTRRCGAGDAVDGDIEEARLGR